MIRLLSIQPVAERGGSDHALLRLVRSLPSDEFDCHLVFPEPSPLAAEFTAAGATLHTIPMARLSGSHGRQEWVGYAAGWPVAVGRIARLARRLEVDVLHSNSLHSWYGWAAALLARRPHVWHAREIVVQSEAALRVERALAHRFARAVICMSEAIADQLERSNVVIVRETVDAREFRPDLAGRFRTRAGIPDDVPLVGAAGRLDTWKGLDVLLDAFEEARNRRPELHLVVAGGPVVGKEAHAARLAARASAIAGVHWMGPRADMPELHADLDLFVLPSIEPEPYGLVVVEALASGVPVVVTDAGGPPEILARAAPDSGRTVPVGDPGRLAAALAELLPTSSSTPARSARRSRQPPSEMDRFTSVFTAAAGHSGRPSRSLSGRR
jgi:glycosyltransferase involved in cell wall biosynthesis